MIRLSNLAYVADALLALAPRDPERPHYSEDAFNKKLILASRREPHVSFRTSQPQFDYMMRQEWREILEMARLTARQREVFCLRAMGHTYEEIGRKNGHTKQGAQNIFLQAVKKIRAAYYVYPYAGLAQVYREQTICRSFERR